MQNAVELCTPTESEKEKEMERDREFCNNIPFYCKRLFDIPNTSKFIDHSEHGIES